ncbi:hypothetical protein APV89_12035 [Staphylococcus aureus]|nr:hypothetical protein CH52_11905 [Staphylococcus aureus]EEV27824.1 conserved hypothetical protein [Staphylococcus aureus A9781]MDR8654886.1 hypothetical protein [Staphylococcus aureus]MDR8690993.1 hypothetical protein [Staphylococcus aureus]MDR8694731.1 hypothetical protein [Staphylococcus aureus]
MTERKCACNKLFSILVRGPNTEADEKSAYNNVQVGEGPQHREFRKEILQAMRVGVWAPTQKLTKSQLTIMCKLGMDPNKEKLYSQFLQTMQVGVGRRNKFCENIISVPLP